MYIVKDINHNKTKKSEVKIMRYWIVVIKGNESRVLDDTSYTSFDYAEYFIKWLEKNPIFEGCTFTIGIEMM